MRTIERTGQFRRDYKREAKGQHRATLDAEVSPVVKTLAKGNEGQIPINPIYPFNTR